MESDTARVVRDARLMIVEARRMRESARLSIQRCRDFQDRIAKQRKDLACQRLRK